MAERLPNQNLPQTQWSLVARAQDFQSTLRRPALDELVRSYLPALRAHLRLRLRLDDATADDVVQGFLAEKLVERQLLACADPSKGRFRSLLLRSLQNYAIDVLRRNRRAATWQSLSEAGPEASAVAPAAAEPQADVFDTTWARQVLVRSLAEMRSECLAQGQEVRWSLFERRVLRPILQDEEPPAYEALIEEFRFGSPQQASNALVSAKRHFQRVLSQVIGEYADSDQELELELADLRSIVRTSGPLGIDLRQLDREVAAVGPTAVAAEPTSAAESLSELFASGSSEGSPWCTADYTGLWLHQLAQPLAAVLADVDQSQFKAIRPATQGASIRELLQHRTPPLAPLRQLKEVARSYVRTGRDVFPAEIATALYFAAIAVALIRARQRITKSDNTVLEHGFRLLLNCSWLDDGTRASLQLALTSISPVPPATPHKDTE